MKNNHLELRMVGGGERKFHWALHKSVNCKSWTRRDTFVGPREHGLDYCRRRAVECRGKVHLKVERTNEWIKGARRQRNEQEKNPLEYYKCNSLGQELGALWLLHVALVGSFIPDPGSSRFLGHDICVGSESVSTKSFSLPYRRWCSKDQGLRSPAAFKLKNINHSSRSCCQRLSSSRSRSSM